MSCCEHADYLGEEVIEFLKSVSSRNVDFRPFLNQWIKRKWPYHYNQGCLMFHAPVGNASLLKPGHKVKVIMSGFCVAGEAGANYVRSILMSGPDSKPELIAAQHTYDTSAMKNGVLHIMSDLKLDEYLEFDEPADVFSSVALSDAPVLCTQALCPIMFEDSWNAEDVWRELLNSPNLRSYAAASLQNWFNQIYDHSDENTVLVLFGKTKNISCEGKLIKRSVAKRGGGELVKLLMCTNVSGSSIEITNKDQGVNSLYEKLLCDFNDRVVCTPHPAYYDTHRSKFMEEISDKVFCWRP